MGIMFFDILHVVSAHALLATLYSMEKICMVIIICASAVSDVDRSYLIV